ncbi:ATP-binding cassette sub-family C member 4-like isoform X1 [Diorhabda carinulata]|uniref:ATP-binding cassette sub-family C member 4-like isoform X1 n=1 Tax=Diorhabda carinulata TaxID=1163345 RepID=UPI0025A2FB78|nr:ATP-binding cassette sub-family C member 4-like isoform X1 [Diorhabda carinulata]
MDFSKRYVKVSPEENANILSRLFFCWFLPFLKYGYKHQIELQDIYNTVPSDLSTQLTNSLQRNWEEEIEISRKRNNKKPSLKKAVFKTFWKTYLFPGIGIFTQCVVIRMIQPLILAEFISFFDTKDQDYLGWIWGSTLILISFINLITTHNSFFWAQRLGMRVRIAMGSLIYRKLLKLSHKSLGDTPAGHVVNLLSNDVQRFDSAAANLHYLWIMPINTLVGLVILYQYVGAAAALTGMVFVTLISLPLPGTISRWQGKLRYKIAVRTDKRVKLMNEITSGIQVIKMYSWEKPFEKVVKLSRQLEVDVISKTAYCYGILSAMSVFTERLVLYVTLITFVSIGQRLTSNVAFSSAQLFNSIQAIMAISFPNALSSYSEAKVSLKRLEEFLTLDENTEQAIRNKETDTQQLGEIKLKSVTANWNPKNIVPTLINVDLHIKPGTLCCVIGNLGSGKSSLLQLLLKELSPSKGEISVSGKTAYASQEPWLFVSNIRNNILFGKPYDNERYRKVINACCLERDFEQFPHSDKNLVGEKGMGLSGGQRARVNLARAVYTEADIYLLDDPLSAVDTKVGRHLFEECILKYLAGKTRILVTHQLQFIKQADLVVIISNGKIEHVGKFCDLSEDYLDTLQHNSNNDNMTKEENIIEHKDIKSGYRTDKIDLQSSISLAHSAQLDDPEESEELIKKGDISNSTYFEYWKSGAGIVFLNFTCLMFILAQVITNASDLWLTHWTNIESRRYKFPTSNQTPKISDAEHVSNWTNDPHMFSTPLTIISDTQSEATVLTNQVFNKTVTALSDLENSTSKVNIITDDSNNAGDRDYYIWIYTILIAGSVIFLTFRSFLYYRICMNASKVLHNKMFSCILKAPIRFFDINPSGRILNRFTKDMGCVDELLPRCQMDAIQILVVMVGILIMVFIVSPLMLIPVILLAPIYYIWRTIYMATAQSLKRHEGAAKAPVFSHISASMHGITTIRASKAQEMVIKEFDTLQDQHTSTWLSFLVSSATFGFYLDLISWTFLVIVTFQFVIFKSEDTLSGSVGLVISQCLILTGMVQYGVFMTAQVAGNMISVERILQYTKLEKEGPFESLATKKPPRDWPSNGNIMFKNIYLRYSHELQPVLKNVNIDIRSREKIGIVGRTGAGKSSLIASLFRLAPIDGIISIDDIDTAEIGLDDLRSKISIIPQEPILFSASVRYNLDPFESHSDEVLWEALENVELRTVITDLNQNISEGGSNFSVGQRQLICLARAIVRNNKILVMDEATANVDPGTDVLIQKTIREKFKNCTVITIAHRLNTVMDSDKVLVMDAGEAVEFDHPHILLQNQDGYFNKMVREMGPEMETMLRSIAKTNYKN